MPAIPAPAVALEKAPPGAMFAATLGALAVVFFGGFAGGLFSVVTRARNKELLPGEDAYFIWYVITKPLVGAFGVILIFLLVGSGLMQSEIMENIGDKAKATVFGYTLISGFTERIIFPNLR